MKLGVLGQNIMDAYYQDYKPDEGFFDLSYFMSMASTAYGKLLNDAYEAAKLLNRATLGFSFVELSSDLLVMEKLAVKENTELKQHYSDLSKPIYTFPFDSMATAVNRVMPFGTDCGEFIKISLDDSWKLCQLPANNKSFYSVFNDKIIYNKFACPELKFVNVMYAPAISSDDADAQITDSLAFNIQTLVLQQMIGAREGTIVDKTNDSNPNKVIQTEIDKNQ